MGDSSGSAFLITKEKKEHQRWWSRLNHAVPLYHFLPSHPACNIDNGHKNTLTIDWDATPSRTAVPNWVNESVEWRGRHLQKVCSGMCRVSRDLELGSMILVKKTPLMLADTYHSLAPLPRLCLVLVLSSSSNSTSSRPPRPRLRLVIVVHVTFLHNPKQRDEGSEGGW